MKTITSVELAKLAGVTKKNRFRLMRRVFGMEKDGNESIQMPRKICLKSENTFEMVRFKRHRNL